MKNILEVNGYKAKIEYDPEIELFRGEFVGLNGGADFYAEDIKGLKKEAEQSLKIYLALCKEKGVEPNKTYSGRFNVRIDSALHQKLALKAETDHKSLNAFVAEAIEVRLAQSS